MKEQKGSHGPRTVYPDGSTVYHPEKSEEGNQILTSKERKKEGNTLGKVLKTAVGIGVLTGTLWGVGYVSGADDRRLQEYVNEHGTTQYTINSGDTYEDIAKQFVSNTSGVRLPHEVVENYLIRTNQNPAGALQPGEEITVPDGHYNSEQ